MSYKNFQDLVCQKFGKLFVYYVTREDSYKRKRWVCYCVCECGRQKKIPADTLTLGYTKSCGCIKRGNYLGQKIGRLFIVNQYIGKDSSGKPTSLVDCVCNCGEYVRGIETDYLKKSPLASCGCYVKEINQKDYTGRKFGKLTAIKRLPKYRGNSTYYECICDCGNEETVFVYGGSLTSGETKSCHCLKRTHAKKGPESHSWKGGVIEKDLVLYDTYANKLESYEEIRRNPDDERLLQVKCTYCGKWINPDRGTVASRLKYIDGRGSGESRFYCPGKGCRSQCPIFYRSVFPKGYKPATSREVQPELRQLVFFKR